MRLANGKLKKKKKKESQLKKEKNILLIPKISALLEIQLED